MKGNPRLSFRVEPEHKDKLESVAHERGMTPTDAAREAIELWTSFPSRTWVQLQSDSQKYQLSKATILGRLLLKRWAMAEAEEWVFPGKAGDPHGATELLFEDFMPEELMYEVLLEDSIKALVKGYEKDFRISRMLGHLTKEMESRWRQLMGDSWVDSIPSREEIAWTEEQED